LLKINYMSQIPIPLNEPGRLEKLKSYQILDTLSEKELDDIVCLATIICNTPMGLITLVDETRQWFKAKVGILSTETARGDSFCQYGIMSKDLMEVQDSLLDSRFINNILVKGPPKIRFYAGAPLTTAEGFNLGTLCVIDIVPKKLNENQKIALGILSRNIMTNFELYSRNKDLETEKSTTKSLYGILSESEKKYREIIEKAGDIFYTSDSYGRFTYINSGVKKHLGYSPEELINQHFTSIVHPDWKVKVREFYLQQFQNKIPDTIFEFPVISKEGSTKWMEQVVVLLHEGVRVTGFQCVVRNIDERKVIQTELFSSKDTFQKTFDKSSNAMIINSLVTGKYTHVNKCFLSLLGFKKEEVIGHTSFDLQFLDPKKRAGILEKLLAQGFLRNYETKLKAKNGKLYDVLFSTEIIELNGEKQTISTCHDISDLKKLQLEILNSKNIAEQSVRFQEQFLANMSHEIRTPMNGIIGMTALLSDSPLNKDQVEYVDTIKISSETLLVIINDILDISKIKDGKIVFEEVELNIHDSIQHVIMTLKLRAEENGIVLLSSVDSQIKTFLIGDPVRLNQILTNLIANAIKFTKKGYVKVSVFQLASTNEYSNIQFVIEDTGIGIQSDKMETIFDNFIQGTKETAFLFGGTGLGLTITKQLIELQGGAITVQSEIDKGSIFTVDMKFLKSAVKLVRKQTDNLPIQVFDLAKARVLLVEDNVINQKVAFLTLSKWGAHVDVAESGLAALKFLKKNTYDVILMDLQMPVMDGEETTKTIRKLKPPFCNIPIIAMTTSALKGEREKCIEMGMNEYISKPFNKEDLYSKVNFFYKGHSFHRDENQDARITDFSILKELSDGNKDFILEMVDVFLLNYPDDLSNLGKAIQLKNYKSIYQNSHKLISSTNLFGVKKARLILEEIGERSRKEIEMDTIALMYEKLKNLCLQAIEEIKIEKKHLKN
jgi:PAS domain S-box-containing protein